MEAEKKFEEIKPGKYEYLVAGILTKDSNGYDLKAKNGNSYKKIKFILLDGDKSHSVYHLVFGAENIKEIVYGIGNPALTFVYESDSKGFNLETLIGESGMLFLGINKSNYPKIECFIKPKPHEILDKKASNESSVSFKQELQEADNVPF